MNKLTLTCISFQPLCRKSLRGFADIRVEQMRLTFLEIAIHERDGRAWAQLPSKPWVKDGCVVTDEDGKAKYTQLFQFDSAAVRNAFSDAAIAAVLRYDARALQCRGAA